MNFLPFYFVFCFFFGGELSSSFDGFGKIDLADLAFDLLIFENQISSLSSNTLIGVICSLCSVSIPNCESLLFPKPSNEDDNSPPKKKQKTK